MSLLFLGGPVESMGISERNILHSARPRAFANLQGKMNMIGNEEKSLNIPVIANWVQARRSILSMSSEKSIWRRHSLTGIFHRQEVLVSEVKVAMYRNGIEPQ